MKLPQHSNVSLADKLFEFDQWITPELGSIKDTDRFKEEIEGIVEVLELSGEVFNNFDDADNFEISTLTDHFIDEFSQETLLAHLLNFSKVLFLVTGKSDNNIKCQFPVYLSHLDDFPGYPIIRNKKIEIKEVPRTIKSESLMGLVSKLGKSKVGKDLLSVYVTFILGNQSSRDQFWAIGNSYFKLKALGKELDLLTPIVQFQVRGSISASGGHIPEQILREQMKDWGLEAGTDFNLNDIVVKDLIEYLTGKESEKKENKKTRAYDFVLPNYRLASKNIHPMPILCW